MLVVYFTVLFVVNRRNKRKENDCSLFSIFQLFQLCNVQQMYFSHNRYLNDLYTLDLSQHEDLQWDVPCTYGQPPTPRESHSAVLHTAENGKHPRLFIYGGMSGCRLGDVFILDVGKSLLDLMFTMHSVVF